MTPSSSESCSPFERLLVERVHARIDFAVVGGVAVSLNGFVRATDDLDIFTRMHGRSLDDFRPRLKYLETREVRIPCLAAPDLILLKQGSWREKDQLDVAALRKSRPT